MKNLLALILLSTGLHATVGAPYLDTVEGAKSSGLAGAYGMVQGNVETLWYNPAGIGALDSNEASITHLLWDQGDNGITGLNNDYGALGVPLGVGTLGFLVEDISTTDTFRDSSGNESGQFGISDWVIGTGYGIRIGQISLGTTVKLLSENVESQSGMGFVGDLGAIGSFFDQHLNIGVSGQNFGRAPILGSSSDPVVAPSLIRAGVGVSNLPKDFILQAEAKFSLVNAYQNNPDYAVGLQFSPDNGGDGHTFGYAIRSGYDFSEASIGGIAGLSLGAGLIFHHFEVNYSWTPYDVLGTAHKLSIGYGGGHL